MAILLPCLLSAQSLHEGMVDVGGHKLHTLLMGEHGPTVVLEVGGTTPAARAWRIVQPEVARFARVLAYDRAGNGASEPGPAPRTARRIAIELNALLAKMQPGPPYVLVGHSFGGTFVRVFAHTYPMKVAGMVLIDPTPEQIIAHKEWQPELERMRKESDANTEGAEIITNLEQARDAWPLPAVPIVLLTAMKNPENLTHRVPLKLFFHQQFASRLPGSMHLQVDGFHNMTTSQPEIVVSSIRLVVDKVRTGTR